jgi:dolichol kinase
MKERLKRELMRKTFHMSGVTVPLVYVLFGRELAILYTSAALIAFVMLEFVRTRAHSLFPMVKTADLIAKQSEKNALAAYVYFCIAAVVSIFFMSRLAVIVGLTAALASDAVAAVVGVGVGRHQIKHKKTVEGTSAGFLTSMVVAYLLNCNFVTVIAVGLVFLTFDLVELGIDDNFTIPLGMVIIVQVIEAIL